MCCPRHFLISLCGEAVLTEAVQEKFTRRNISTTDKNRRLLQNRFKKDTSIPSIVIAPLKGSTNRKRAVVRVDFPAPVRPTIPTYVLYLI